MKDIINFYNKIARPLVLDGAIGSLLQQRDIEIDDRLWSSYANIIAPEKVIEIHNEYINAGADIITTNTFRTNPNAYKNSTLNISNYEFVKRSVKLAFATRNKKREIFVAGSNPPAEDCYQTKREISKIDIESNHKDHIDMLWESGVDLILNETQSHFDEIKVICEHCKKMGIPFIISLFLTAEGKLLSGESLQKVLKFITEYNPIAVGINCIYPKVFGEILKNFESPIKWGFYLNCGSGTYSEKEIFEGVTPSRYINIIDKKYKKNPFFIGSCCGSSPLHTKAIKDFIIGKYKSKSSG